MGRQHVIHSFCIIFSNVVQKFHNVALAGDCLFVSPCTIECKLLIHGQTSVLAKYCMPHNTDNTCLRLYFATRCMRTAPVDWLSSCTRGWNSTANTKVFNGTRVWSASSLDDCKAACLNRTNCSGLDWHPGNIAERRCWLHGPWTGPRIAYLSNGITHFEVISKCKGEYSYRKIRAQFWVHLGHLPPNVFLDNVNPFMFFFHSKFCKLRTTRTDNSSN